MLIVQLSLIINNSYYRLLYLSCNELGVQLKVFFFSNKYLLAIIKKIKIYLILNLLR